MRYKLTDAQWAMLEPLLPERRTRGRPYGTDHRVTVEGILWIAYTGAQWRELPERYGNWNSVWRRFRRWAQRGVFSNALAVWASGLDLSIAQVDGTFVKVHQDAAGARKLAGPLPSPEDFRPSGQRQGATLPSSSR